MTEAPRWRKSSHSGQETDCVELAHTLDALRDSKNPTGPTLHADIATLLTVLKADQIGH